MTGLVLDCSVAMAWCFEDEAQPALDALLIELPDRGGALVPALWYWETANALHSAARRSRIKPADIAARLNVLERLPITADVDGAARAWRETLLLAQSHALTVYDAAYLELAVRIGGDLATTDKQLRAASARIGVPTLP